MVLRFAKTGAGTGAGVGASTGAQTSETLIAPRMGKTPAPESSQDVTTEGMTAPVIMLLGTSAVAFESSWHRACTTVAVTG